MSSSLKSPPEGLKALECKKEKSGPRPPIPYVPPTKLIKKQEGKVIKVKMLNGTNFGMAAFTSGTNKDHIVRVIVVLQIIKKKGLASKIKVAWDAILAVRREMRPYLNFPEDKTLEANHLWKQTLAKFKEILKAKKVVAIAKSQKVYEMFRLFVAGNQQTQWDKIVHEMHTKDPWVGVDGSSHKNIRVHSWLAFLDCIKLHKMTILPVDAT